jgi:uncharacterized protein YndB with AHSA1/START domain
MIQEESAGATELSLVRIINAAPDKVFRAWTEPELLKQWFTPSPWTVEYAELDVRPGGTNLIVMRSPEGQEYPNRGVYLEVVKNQRLVMTDAYTHAWQPSGKPFMTAIITFENEAGKTGYTARVLHWSPEDRKAHEEKGLSRGVGQGQRTNWLRWLKNCDAGAQQFAAGATALTGRGLSSNVMPHGGCAHEASDNSHHDRGRRSREGGQVLPRRPWPKDRRHSWHTVRVWGSCFL